MLHGEATLETREGVKTLVMHGGGGAGKATP
jgi:hypothetical protein